jgi:hypothetical protein
VPRPDPNECQAPSKIGYCTTKEWNLRPSYGHAEQGFTVRLMSPLGSYPDQTLNLRSSVLAIAPDLCFTIVRQQGEDESFSEVDSLSPSEIPLVGSIMLSSGIAQPYISPYPGNHSLIVETSEDEELTESCISRCRAELLAHMSDDRPDRLYRSNTIHHPPARGGLDYELYPSDDVAKRAASIFECLNSAGPVMIRGVGSLLKANMAWRHFEFMEAACLFLWISLDAAHSITLQKLREAGTLNPTSADAGRFFDQISGFPTPWEKFFEWDYENRIRVFHPDNRFGAEARPQLLADDFLELNELLIAYFRYLAVGEFVVRPELRG